MVCKWILRMISRCIWLVQLVPDWVACGELLCHLIRLKVRDIIKSLLKMSMPPPLPPPQPANVRNNNMAHLNPLPPSVFTLTQTAQLEALYTIIRDKETSRGDFLFYSDRVIRLLVEEGLNHLPVVSRTVETPTVSWLPKMTFSSKVGNGALLSSNGNTSNNQKKSWLVNPSQYQGATYNGVGFEGKICGVSILRAGEVRDLLLHFYFRTNRSNMNSI